MKARDIANIPLHVVGAALLVLAVCWSYWMLIPNTLIWAFLREQAQHRYILEDMGFFGEFDQRLYTVEKRTFFDFSWLGWHQAFEIAQWGIGATVACVLWRILGG